MSTPHIERFTDEHGNIGYRAEFGGTFLSKEEVKALSKYVSGILDENAKLRELCRHLRECTRHNVCALCDYKGCTCDFDYDMRELGVDA